MIFVVDVDGARQALRGGLLRCPDCDGRLGGWAVARTRRLRGPSGPVEVTPDRARCRDCRRTHVVLPAFVVPRRAYTADVVGAALLAPAAPGRPVTDVPAATARRWRRAVRQGARMLVSQACRVAGAFGADVFPEGPQHPPAGELTAALRALATAAGVFARQMPVPVRCQPGAVSGIDYLALLEAEHRADLARRLHLADADRAGALHPWPAVNVITAGRLLTGPSG